jgi:putative transposase
MNEQPTRKSNRLKNYDYNSSGAYHITICSDNRECIFSEINMTTYELTLTNIGKIVEESLKFLNNKPGQYIDKYVIMPNHIHFILMLPDKITTDDRMHSRVSKTISSLKRFTNRKVGKNLWQRSSHDRIIRDEKEYLEHWRYIDENPMKWSVDEYYKDTIFVG